MEIVLSFWNVLALMGSVFALARPLAVGLIIAAVVTAFVPANFFATTFGGNDWLAMPAMVLLGFPMYVCSTASIPIAASLVAKGLTPGAAFVFLMAAAVLVALVGYGLINLRIGSSNEKIVTESAHW